jgi:glycerol uptake facilitator-like aquaporin
MRGRARTLTHSEPELVGVDVLGASLEPPLQSFDLGRRLAAEGLGTALLLAIVIGSGIMGERLARGDLAMALLGNTLATGAGLVVLITIFGPLSGAHFNPAVTLVFAARREIGWRTALAYIGVQVAGAIAGVFIAHAMFAEPILQISAKLRAGPAQAFSEAVATFGLIGAILGSLRFRAEAAPMIVGLYITAAYWFTASTSFANPAVTIARSLSDTFAGIAPASVPAFVAAQLLGAGVATCLFGWLLKSRPVGHGAGSASDRGVGGE